MKRIIFIISLLLNVGLIWYIWSIHTWISNEKKMLNTKSVFIQKMRKKLQKERMMIDSLRSTIDTNYISDSVTTEE